MKIGDVSAKKEIKIGKLMLICGAIMLFISAFAKAEDRITVEAFPNRTFRPENTVTLPPGEITGTALQSDQVTPYSNIKVALLNPETGEAAASTVTDEDGKFVFEDLPEGRYVIQVGNPGIISLLDVEGGANPSPLDIAVPRPTALPVPGWAPGWVQQSPALGYAIVGGAVVGGVAYWRYRRERDRELSPIMP